MRIGPSTPTVELLDQIEHPGLGPVGVFENDGQRADAGQVLEESADREGLLACGGSRRNNGLEAAAGLHHHLPQRQGRGALAVRGTAADQHGRLLAEAGHELPHDTGLSDSGFARHGDQATAALFAGSRVGLAERLELPEPVDETRVHGPGGRLLTDLHLKEAQRVADLVDRDRRAAEGARGGADPDLARRGRPLEPLSRRDHVAADEAVADEHLARVDPDAEGDGPLNTPQLVGGTHRAKGIVLVRRGNTEDPEELVTGPDLDRPAVLLDRRAGIGQGSCREAVKPLRIDIRRRQSELAEHDRDRLSPLLDGRKRRGEVERQGPG